ncbi:MAG: hypothetical protein JXR63_05835 [Spirochaetales bacterium]|nr:hypothetical protein [Spirochaetales bacterium]
MSFSEIKMLSDLELAKKEVVLSGSDFYFVELPCVNVTNLDAFLKFRLKSMFPGDLDNFSVVSRVIHSKGRVLVHVLRKECYDYLVSKKNKVTTLPLVLYFGYSQGFSESVYYTGKGYESFTVEDGVVHHYFSKKIKTQAEDITDTIIARKRYSSKMGLFAKGVNLKFIYTSVGVAFGVLNLFLACMIFLGYSQKLRDYEALLLNKINLRQRYLIEVGDSERTYTELLGRASAIKDALGVDTYGFLSQLSLILGRDATVYQFSLQNNDFTIFVESTNPLGKANRLNADKRFADVVISDIKPIENSNKSRYKISGKVL